MAVIKRDLYFDELVDFVDGENLRGVLWRLYTTEFYWFDDIIMDRNRAMDGLKLRHEDKNVGYSVNCSVLEMLIGMAIRCESDIMHVNGAGDRTIEWFWIMIGNLGLDNPDLESDLHDEIAQKSAEDHIEFVLDQFLNRKYDYYGKNGGLFELKYPRGDLRKADLWQQLNWWLVENYGYENE